MSKSYYCSTATVPVTIACFERIGIPNKIAKFIVPIGATINMDGIALYESIGAIFIIQLHGLQFSLFRIIIIRSVSRYLARFNAFMI